MTLPRILVVEPYFGGSHRLFLRGLRDHVEAQYTFLTLPARRWKMRMQLSAPWFAEQVCQLAREERGFDAVLCSSFVDVAVLRALLSRVAGWNGAARFCTYFHENQFVYPNRMGGAGTHQFTSINFMSAVASDRLAFNSEYNLRTFLDSSHRYLKKSADMCILGSHQEVAKKSIVLYPGLEYSHIDGLRRGKKATEPVIVWNHRWEHDKNPEEFFAALRSLQMRGLAFKLILLGQSFDTAPECFARAEHYFGERIIHCGYVESRREYAALLSMGDIVVSTSTHEFFGISVLEAVRAGCRPLLPARLSYPELFPARFLYEEGELEARLAHLLETGEQLAASEAMRLTARYDWRLQRERYQHWLLGGTE